ncbi:MAG: hypothetical protein SGPRY_014107 [Prymnesium sp.]
MGLPDADECLPPPRFGAVEPGVYRSAFPSSECLDQLRLLNLRSVVNLSQEALSRTLSFFLADGGIEVHNVGLEVWTRLDTPPITHELICEALRLVLDRTRHPILLMSSSGSHQVGTLVGCLRRLQHWNLSAILCEYRSFSAPTPRLWCEHFIEQFDEDLVSFPPNLPRWFEIQQQLLIAEQAEWESGKSLSPERLAHYTVHGPLVSPGISTTLVDDPSVD